MAPKSQSSSADDVERQTLLNGSDGGEQGERQPLLNGQYEEEIEIDFEDNDSDNPRNWPNRKKYINVVVIAAMASKSQFYISTSQHRTFHSSDSNALSFRR